jgi:hypothetical protein
VRLDDAAEHLARQRHGAGEAGMVVREPGRDQRRHDERLGDAVRDAAHDRLGDEAVRAQRQVRPVLLDGAHLHDPDGVAGELRGLG